MALFGKRSTGRAAAPSPPPAPIEVTEATLRRAEAVLERFERALGGPDAPLREAIRSVSETGGGLPMEKLMMRGGDVKDNISRPWRWLAAVAEHAAASREDRLAARVFMFAAWFRSMKSRLMMADYMDMWLDPVPDREWSRVVSAGVVSLTRLPADVVIPESRERWVAGDVVRLAATELEALEQQGVTVAAEAREAVARYQSRPE